MKKYSPENEAQGNALRFIEICDEKIAVSEDVYYAYMRPVWAERKRQERWSRCRKPDGSRCEDDCSKCFRQRTGSALSLEHSREEGFDPVDTTVDVEEAVAQTLLMEMLHCTLSQLDPDSRWVCQMISQGASERKIAGALGISQSTFNYRKNMLLAHLRENLKNNM